MATLGVKVNVSLPAGISLVTADDLETWYLDIKVLDDNPLYLNQTFRLMFRFGPQYPIGKLCAPLSRNGDMLMMEPEPPEVTFVQKPDRPIPIHPHIYSNGIICLDLLGQQGWSPVQNVESICMSLQSMLTGNTKNERPPGDEEFVRSNRLRPKDIDFYYHDNKV